MSRIRAAEVKSVFRELGRWEAAGELDAHIIALGRRRAGHRTGPDGTRAFTAPTSIRPAAIPAHFLSDRRTNG